MKGGWGGASVIQEALKCAILAAKASVDAGGRTSFTFSIRGGLTEGLLPPHLLPSGHTTI